MIRAITPPRQKYTNDVTRYMYPMTLWSVDVMIDTSKFPFLVAGTFAVVAVRPPVVVVTDVNFLRDFEEFVTAYAGLAI